MEPYTVRNPDRKQQLSLAKKAGRLPPLKQPALFVSELLNPPSFSYLFPLAAEQSPEKTADPAHLARSLRWVQERTGQHLFMQFTEAYLWSRDKLSDLSLRPKYTLSVDGWREARAYRALLN